MTADKVLQYDDHMATFDDRGIYFNSALLPKPSYEYVCWVDVMGIANQMVRSLPMAANFIFKLHCAVLNSLEVVGDPQSISLYPVIDGAYITASERGPIQEILGGALSQLANEFVKEPELKYRFIARAAIAYGPVFHGRHLPEKISYVLANHTEVRDSILLGAPMGQAYREERNAPPFGVAIDESARTFASQSDQPFRFIWFDWYTHVAQKTSPSKLMTELDRYFEWQRNHCNMTGYDIQRIDHHRKLASEYWQP